MKIGFVSTQPGWGGGENLLGQLVLALRRRGAKTVLAAPQGSGAADWAHRQEGLPLLELPGKGRGPIAAWRLRQWQNEERCDLVMLNDPHAITWGGLGLAGAGVPRIGVRTTSFPVRSAWKHNRLVDRVICISESAREECLKSGVEPGQTEVIYGGIDPPELSYDQVVQARQLFEQAASNGGGKHLVAVGSLLPVKGFDTLIEAVALGARRGEPWRLWIAGEGEQRPELERLIDRLGVSDRVTLLGFRKDVSALLAAADLFVSASHSEGLSLVMIEAMRAGRRTVATPVGGAREVMRMGHGDSSEIAWPFQPGDAQGLAETIATALQPTPENQHKASEAQRWAEERFSIDRMAADYLALFESIVGANPPRRRAA